MGKYELRTFGSPDELARVAAEEWLAELGSHTGNYHAAFSGGRIARNFCRELTRGAKENRPALERVHFFWADERCVPPTNAESNYKLILEEFLRPAAISENRIHRVRGEDPPEVAARLAEEELRKSVPLNAAGCPALEMIFLGMGEDGHVASLFPPIRDEQRDNIFMAVTATKPPPQRISLTYAMIAAAQNVWVLASGEGKAEPLRESLRADGKTPLAEVIRRRERTKILTDIRL